jgi:hypothetical protein
LSSTAAALLAAAPVYDGLEEFPEAGKLDREVCRSPET